MASVPTVGEISTLRVADENFLVVSLIERCPKTMMLRELVRNAVEAALSAPEGRRNVVIDDVIVDQGRKLRIWNTGTGLSRADLHRICDIASSIGKPHGLDGNFGMGAKVASLPSNQHGLRYRSCRLGQVHEVIMGKRGGQYGRVMIDGADIRDVTSQARAEGRDTTFDWTEVTLLGNHPGHDTARDPYEGNPEVPVNWVEHGLLLRFLRLPESVTITVPGGHTFVPRDPAWKGVARHDIVRTAQGPLIHYIHNPDAAVDFGCGVAFRDEFYDLRFDRDWRQMAPSFGVTFGAVAISILVELPDTFPVVPDAYRQFLRQRDGEQQHIESQLFGRLVSDHMPDWMRRLIAEMGPDTSNVRAVQAELGDLLRNLGVKRSRPRRPPNPNPNPNPNQNPAARGDSRPDTDRRPVENRSTQDLAHDSFDAEPPPTIVPIRDTRELEDRGLIGRGGQYFADSHQLLINMQHRSVNAMAEVLAAEFAHHPDLEKVRALAQGLAEEALIRRMGRALVHGLAWREEGSLARVDPPFSEWESQQAIAVPALTLIAADFSACLRSARAEMAARLKT